VLEYVGEKLKIGKQSGDFFDKMIEKATSKFTK